MQHPKHTKKHYVYRITHLAENKHYYGVRSSKVDPKMDLGITYFSSSTDKEFKQDQKENPQNYKYKIIKIFETRLEAILLEISLHKKFNVGVNERFYNRAIQTSTGFDMLSGTVGRTHSEETKLKLSNINKGKTHSDETKTKMSQSRTGTTRSDETKARMSKAQKGRTVSDETKANMSKAQKGRTHSDESKLKMSQLRKGKPRSEETKLKISEANKGKTRSDESKVNMSKAQKGKTHSDETKTKMSQSRTGRPRSEETKLKLSNVNKGKTLSDETKVKLSEARKGRIHIQNILENKSKMINPDDFPEYEKLGWIRGRKKFKD